MVCEDSFPLGGLNHKVKNLETHYLVSDICHFSRFLLGFGFN